MDFTIRTEERGDERHIRRVLCEAFPTCAEGDLVERLRVSGRLIVSLVAEGQGGIVGYVGFSPVTLDDVLAPGLGLGPLAVCPEHQRSGVGTSLVKAGLSACRETGAEFVVVLGDPVYYARFGFETASINGLTNEYDVDDPFKALELRPGALAERSGLVRYAVEFAGM